MAGEVEKENKRAWCG